MTVKNKFVCSIRFVFMFWVLLRDFCLRVLGTFCVQIFTYFMNCVLIGFGLLLSFTPDFSQITFHFSSLLFESRGSVFNRTAIFTADEHAKFEKDTLNEVVIS